MVTKEEIIASEKERLGKNNPSYNLQLADLVMMQMAGNFEKFLEVLSSADMEKTSTERYEEANKMITETKEQVTTPQLFPKIVDKTVEAQFGEKHTTVRELGQNGIDSYNSADICKEIAFTTEEQKDHIVLKVRDYGVGMNLESLIRDLLVPYNSGKEFDPTKIGEHGIGWYSIVDLADFVKVTTRTRNADHTTQALVYREDATWKTTIYPNSIEQLKPNEKMHLDSGTEVTAFILKSKTNVETLEKFLYQYLGMVDQKDGKITFNSNVINFMRPTYDRSLPTRVQIDDEEGYLIMGVSDRELDNSFNDPRFTTRNQSLDKILFTQRGFFIKYDSNLFQPGSIHSSLLGRLTDMGLDFWIEVPENVTLTKGRNNVIADHYPAVLESSYKAFETLFLDNILTDSRILNHSSNILFESIAQIFNESYQKADAMIEAEESKKYSTRRKMMASLAKFGSKTADLCSTIGESIGKLKDETGKAIKAAGLGVGKGIYYIGKGMFYTFPRSLGEFIRESTSSNPNPEWQARMQAARARARQISSAFLRKSWDIAKGTVIYTGCGLSVVATGVGSYLGASQLGKIAWKLYEKYGNQGLVYCAEAIGAAGLGYLAYRKIKSSGITLKGIARGIKRKYNSIKDYMQEVNNRRNENSKDKPSRIINWAGEIVRCGRAFGRFLVKERHLPEIDLDFGNFDRTKILGRFGLYKDIEEKREYQRQKRINKVSKKYLSAMQRNDFFRRIMNKEIIPAIAYESVKRTKEPEKNSDKKNSWDSFKEIMKESWGFGDLNKLGPYTQNNWSYSPRNSSTSSFTLVSKKEVKISIDKIVRLHLEGKLRSGDKWDMNNGEYWVDKTNPLVDTILTRLKSVTERVNDRYDVRILEDRIDNIIDSTKGFLDFVKRSGIGLTKAAVYLSGIGPLMIIGSKYSRHIYNPFEGSAVDKNTFLVYEGSIKLARELGAKIREKKESIARERAKSDGEIFETVKEPKDINGFPRAIQDSQKTYKEFVMPLLGTINPIKYPGYVRRVSRGIFDVTRATISSSSELLGRAYNSISKAGKDKSEQIKTKFENYFAEMLHKRKIRLEMRAELAEKKKIKIEEAKLAKEEEKKRIRELEELSGSKQSIYERSLCNIQDFYQRVIRRKPNREYGEEDCFHNLSYEKFERIVNSTKLSYGNRYLSSVKIIKEIDDLVSRALGEKTHKILVHCEDLGFLTSRPKFQEKSYKDQETFQDKEGNIHALISTADSKRWECFSVSRDGLNVLDIKENPSGLTAFCYRVLDDLIHFRTHQTIGDYEHCGQKQSTTQDTLQMHPFNFYPKKEELSQRVVDYLQKNNIILEEAIRPYLPRKEEYGAEKYKNLKELSKIVNFLRKRMI